MNRTTTLRLSQWLGLVVFLISFFSSCTVSEKKVQQPNIVLILADDLGYSDLGVHGNKLVETPNLDQLATGSVQFSQFYVTPVCASTRASLLTGRNFLRTGVSHVHGGKDFLHLDEVTLAEELKKAGYATGMWGKWHSGKTPGYFPWERGFDEAYMAALYRHRDNRGVQNGEARSTEGWYSEVLVDDAIDFIDRNSEGPFFAYLPFMACHAPLLAPDEYVQKYRAKGLSENLSTLYAMVDHMDHHIGRLISYLDEQGLDENTVVLFLSDNGPAVINNLLSDEDRRIRYVNGLRGHKGNIWENGIKSPLFVRWKGTFSPATVDHLVDVCDLFPSLLELAGVEREELPEKLDGRSILSYFEEGAEVMEGKEIFLYANPGWPPSDRPWTPEGIKDEYRPWKYAGGDNLSFEKQIIGIRTENFKLLMNPGATDGSIERDGEGFVLMDIRNDMREEENIAGKETARFEQMKESLKSLYEDVYGSPHAFEMPVFRIDSSLGSNPVLAYAPRRSSPAVKGAAGYLKGFTWPGSWAEYDVEVQKAGSYSLDLDYEYKGDRPLTLSLDTGDDVSEILLEPGKQMATIGAMDLSAGNQRWTLKSGEKTADGDLTLRKFTVKPRIH